MTLTESDYWIAACSDIAYEDLPVDVVTAACRVSENAEQFFWAVQAAVMLKEVCGNLGGLK